MPFEELERQHIAFEAITRAARRDEIARIVRAAAGQRHHVVEGGAAMVESRRAVHAALATVAQGGAAHGLLRRHVRRNPWPK